MFKLLKIKILKLLINNNIWFPHVVDVFKKEHSHVVNFNYGIWVEYIFVNYEWINIKNGKKLPDKIKWILNKLNNIPENISTFFVNRFEVISNIEGRILYHSNVKIDMSFQHNLKTLKVFIFKK